MPRPGRIFSLVSCDVYMTAVLPPPDEMGKLRTRSCVVCNLYRLTKQTKDTSLRNALLFCKCEFFCMEMGLYVYNDLGEVRKLLSQQEAPTL